MIRHIEDDGTLARIDIAERIATALQLSPCYLAYGQEGHFIAADTLRSEGAGARLLLAREKAGMNKATLARAAGIAQNTVLHIESGRTMPSVATVEDLAKALRISPCWLAYGEGAEDAPWPAIRRRRKTVAPRRASRSRARG